MQFDQSRRAASRQMRGLVLQKFRSTCSSGLSDRFTGKTAAFKVELMQKGEHRGQHVAEITTSDDNGNIIYLREAVSP